MKDDHCLSLQFSLHKVEYFSLVYMRWNIRCTYGIPMKYISWFKIRQYLYACGLLREGGGGWAPLELTDS